MKPLSSNFSTFLYFLIFTKKCLINFEFEILCFSVISEMRQVGICFNTNNIKNLQHQNILEKQLLSQQSFSTLKVDTMFEQQNIFIPASSSSSCSTFSSSPSASPNPYMSPPILRKEMDNVQNWDEDKDDVFFRMPKLEPEVLLENNNDDVFFTSNNNNNNNNHLIQSLYPTKCFNLTDISSISTCSSTSSGVWSSTADNIPLTVPNIFVTDKKLKKEEDKIKNEKTIENTNNEKMDNVQKQKRKYVRRKIKNKIEEKEKKQEIKEEIVKKRRGRKRKNILNEESLKREENNEEKKENVKAERGKNKLEEDKLEKTKNKLEAKDKLEQRKNKLEARIKEKEKKKKISFKMDLRIKRNKIENNQKMNNLNNKRGRKYQIKQTEEEIKENLKKKNLIKEKELLNNITTNKRRRKRKALLLAKSKLLALKNKKEERKNIEVRHSRRIKINSKVVQFSSSSSASPSPSRFKFVQSKSNKKTLISSISEPLSFISNWRPIGQGIFKQLPLRRVPDSNEENVKKYLCFNSIQHLFELEVKIQLGDNVLIKSEDYADDIFVGRVLSIHYEPIDNSLLLTLLWFYTGKQLPSSMRLNNLISKFDENELFASRHLDIVNADSVEGITQVLTFSEYCRYKAQLAIERLPLVRRPPNWASPCPRFKQNQNMDDSDIESNNDDECDSNTSVIDTVFFCRSIFSIHSKRVRSKFLQLDKSSADTKKPNGSNTSKNVLRILNKFNFPFKCFNFKLGKTFHIMFEDDLNL
ncbi:BAH domain-containing protein [Meloidogyne graminicola]|uniref:BAH domain-containing protein n=1 Tax=Meloidogyne graminicola TaxID=189291 RepID=A0A8S9ZIQ2_9BILA|nr:BAH domain-containing protein [Meloidogyne graminicola]